MGQNVTIIGGAYAEPAPLEAYSAAFRAETPARFTRLAIPSGNALAFTVSAWLRIPSIQRAWTLLWWGSGTTYSNIRAIAADPTYGDTIMFEGVTSGVRRFEQIPAAQFRDTGGWGHLVVGYDYATATVTMHWNGLELELALDNTDALGTVGIGDNLYVGSDNVGNQRIDGLVSRMHLVDGLKLEPTEFGQLDGQEAWVPRDPNTAGWNPLSNTGSYLFDDDTNLGADTFNSNDLTNENVEQRLDGPELAHPTMSVFDNAGQAWTLQRCGQHPVNANFGGFGYTCRASQRVPDSGKWYWEAVCDGTLSRQRPGVTRSSGRRYGTTPGVGVYPDLWLAPDQGTVWDADSNQIADLSTVWAAGDVVGLAVDADARTLQFSKNGVPAGAAVSLDPYCNTLPIDPAAYSYNGSGCIFNFGQGVDGSVGFAHTPPEDFLPIASNVMPSINIDPRSFVEAPAYIGNASSGRAVTLRHSTGLVLTKRLEAAGDWLLEDGERPPSWVLRPNGAVAESIEVAKRLGFSGTTFVLGSDAETNALDEEFIALSLVASATAGMSATPYTGDGQLSHPVGHGLTKPPQMVWWKNRNAVNFGWLVGADAIDDGMTWSDVLLLHTNGAKTDGSTTVNGKPDATNVDLAGGAWVNQLNATYMMYSFHSVPGISDYGAVIANASAEGAIVNTGFTPAVLFFKNIDATGDWVMVDATRNMANPCDRSVVLNENLAEVTGTYVVDRLAHGFQVRSTMGWGADQRILYAAFSDFNASRALAVPSRECVPQVAPATAFRLLADGSSRRLLSDGSSNRVFNDA